MPVGIGCAAAPTPSNRIPALLREDAQQSDKITAIPLHHWLVHGACNDLRFLGEQGQAWLAPVARFDGKTRRKRVIEHRSAPTVHAVH
ncbi:MAG: hypothetical protein ABIQ16_00865 [Polyangiaceae bacterium]